MRTTNAACAGLDLGGTGAKAGVFDAAGTLLGFAQRRIEPDVPAPGQAEIPLEAIETAAREAVREAVAAAGAPVRALSVVTQGQTFVSLDSQNRPLHPVILWYDSRAGEQARRLLDTLSAGAAPWRAVPAIASAPKIMWWRERDPARMARARRFLLLPDLVAYRLTGRAVTEPTAASSTGLYDGRMKAYHPAALAAAGIRLEQLASVQAPGTEVGPLLPDRAADWGLPPDCRLIVGVNDQYAGALGAGNCRPGIVSETSGTCLALVTLAETLPAHLPPGLIGGSYVVAPYQYILAYAKTSGVALDWFRALCGGVPFAQLDREAAAVPPGCRGLTVCPHFDGRVSPRPDPAVRGAFHGLSLTHTRADLYRGLLEGLAFSLRENLDALARLGLEPAVIRCIGGGARNVFWLQIKADVTGRAVEQPAVTEAAVLGAALLAAWGTGAVPSLAAGSEAWYRADRTFRPGPDARAAYDEPYARYLRLPGAPAGPARGAPV